ncbi:Parp12 [Symbiodinium necroappetens]|uniref:Poly [ADP-ribose] polymerase n=1 Tax=Symbiodinium necroappetens TaxID=1628268 RepID=A0A812P081_9DINO|nr:Parp12 [Symbiodinium necroappetens]
MRFGRLLFELLLGLAFPSGNAVFDTFERVGDGFCLDSLNRSYDAFTMLPFQHYHCCLDACMEFSFSNAESPGFHITPDGNCTIFMNDGYWPRGNSSGFHSVHTSSTGSGRISEAEPGLSHTVADGCWRKRGYRLDVPTNGSSEDPETGGSHPGLADFIEEDFAYCLSAGAIPGPAIINTASTMESCWSYCSEKEHCEACFRNCEIGNCSEREAGCTYYAVQFCDSGRRSDCGVRSLRRKTVFDGRSEPSDMIPHLVGLLALFCAIQGNAGEETEFNSMLYVGEEQWAPFAELLDSTYRARSSQDRPCPDGACPKRPGGCPCVQPDGEPGLPASYVIRRVLRAENSGSWTRFVEKRAQLRSRRQGMGKVEDPVCTAGVVDQHPELFTPVDASLNEVYLWHGTHIRAALNIAHEGFDIQMAGLNGTMYGKGMYFAENSTKADEYARDEPHGFYQDVFALLLCRVCLGKFHFSEDRFDSAGGMAEAGTIDSTVGDRTRAANTFREFTAYDPDQVYPEYVIFYSRRPKAVALEAFRFGLPPLHPQLPNYFQNFHLNPQVKSFEVQYGVRRPERDGLEQMAQACYPGGRRIEVLSARRIEISSLWNRYVLYKRRLRGELEASGLTAFASAEFLEGQARGAEILTDAFMKRPSEGGGRPTWRGESLEGELQAGRGRD